MTFGGWICMTGAIGFVTALFGWCCWRIVGGARENNASFDEERQDKSS